MQELFRQLPRVSNVSLREIFIVLITVGILGAIAVPICNANLLKARISEADANLSSIRTQLRIYSSQTGSFPKMNPAGYVVGADWNTFKSGQMSGKYFNDSSYTYFSADGNEFTITCTHDSELPSNRTLNQSGVLSGGS